MPDRIRNAFHQRVSVTEQVKNIKLTINYQGLKKEVGVILSSSQPSFTRFNQSVTPNELSKGEGES